MRAILLLLCLPLFVCAQPVWDMKRLEAAPAIYPSAQIQSADPRIRALFFEGLPYHGKPTRVFAWLGIPKDAGKSTAPGMVLVHGGGGTAFKDWVKLWVDRGYAAIAMDTCGALPEPEVVRPNPRPRHEHSGPPGWGGFDQLGEKPEDQWTYHAVAAAVRAHSLLRVQPGVDPNRIGLTGISWGGYLTCIIGGVDSRFAFAAPVYGCGHYLDTTFGKSVKAAGAGPGERWLQWWDPSHYLPNIKAPTLWVNGTNDFAYWLPAWQKSYRLVPIDHRTLALRPRMPHGQGPGAAPKEIEVFADSLLKGGVPLATITAQQRQDRAVTVSFQSSRPIVKAELNFTADTTSPWPERLWKAIPATVGATAVTAELPAEAKLYFVNLFDDRDCVVSTEHAELVAK